MASRIWLNDVLPFTALISTTCASVGLNTLFKAASREGLSYYVFIVYDYAINTLVLLPAPLIFCSKTEPPSRLQPLVWRILLLGSLGLLSHICGYKGIEYSSPTLSSAMSNLKPAITFSFAIIFRELVFLSGCHKRMEKLELRSSSFQAKFFGTLVSISGALVVVLYNGPIILQDSFPTDQTSIATDIHWSRFVSSESNWIIGGFLLIAQNLIFSLWYIVMTDTMSIYPAQLVVSFFHCLCVTSLAIPLGFLAETDMNAWRLATKSALVALICSGLFGPAFLTVVHSWSLHLKGPVYVSAFEPLSIVIAVVVGVIFLGDTLHLGSVIGSVILSMGVYGVIWGKALEEKIGRERNSSSLAASSSGRTPLLQTQEIQEV